MNTPVSYTAPLKLPDAAETEVVLVRLADGRLVARTPEDFRSSGQGRTRPGGRARLLARLVVRRARLAGRLAAWCGAWFLWWAFGFPGAPALNRWLGGPARGRLLP